MASAKPATVAPGTAAAAPHVAISPDGTRIAYQTQGTGPPLILIHGGGQTRRSWNERGYVDRLGKSFTIITLDQRGSGDSDKPAAIEAYALDRVLADVLAVADATGARRFQLWGFGRGATIGRYLAARSDRVISAVLVATPMGPPVTAVTKSAMTSMRDYWRPLLQAKRAGTLNMASLSAGDRATLAGDTPIIALVLGALVDYPPLEPETITAPTLWVVGSGDAATLANAKQYEKRLAGTSVTLKILNGASYTDCFARSSDMIAAIQPFLNAQATVRLTQPSR